MASATNRNKLSQIICGIKIQKGMELKKKEKKKKKKWNKRSRTGRKKNLDNIFFFHLLTF